MRAFLIGFAVVGLIGLGLWLKHKGVIFSKTDRGIFLVTPEEVTTIINKDKFEIAQFFFEKNIHRQEGYGYTQYCWESPYGVCSNSHGIITTYDSFPQTLFCEFRDKKQFEDFFRVLRQNDSVIAFTHSDSTGRHVAFRLNGIIFVQIGYKMDNTYNAEIFSPDREKLMKNNIRLILKDTITKVEKDSFVTQPRISFGFDSCLATFKSSHFEGESKNTAITFSDRNGDMFHFEGTLEMATIEGEARLFENQLTIISGNAGGNFFLYNDCKKLVAHLTNPDTASYILKRKYGSMDAGR